MKNKKAGLVIWLMVFGFLLYFINNVRTNKDISYSDFKQYLTAGAVIKAEISENFITGKYRSTDGSTHSFKVAKAIDPQLGVELEHYAVPHTLITSTTTAISLIESWGPMVLLIVFWLLMLSGKIKPMKQNTESADNKTNEIDKIIK